MPAHPRPTVDERDNLLVNLEQQRLALRIACHGLTDDRARATPTPSALTLGGLVKHLTVVERQWMSYVCQRPEPDTGDYTTYLEGFRLRVDETLSDALADYERAARETHDVIAGIDDLGMPVPVPDAPWFPQDVEAWSVRWVLAHLITETARHAGHADIIREAIDGASSLSLMAAAEGWPPSPWLQPWQPVRG